MKKIIILSAALLGFNLASNAQTNATANANQNVVLTLSNAISISYSSTDNHTNGSDVTLPFTTVENYENGVTSSAQTLYVKSNKSFHVNVNTTSDKFSYTGSESSIAPDMMVADVLKAKISNYNSGTAASTFASAFTALSNTSSSLLTGATKGGDRQFDITYKATPGFNFPSGTYTANVVYTATQD